MTERRMNLKGPWAAQTTTDEATRWAAKTAAKAAAKAALKMAAKATTKAAALSATGTIVRAAFPGAAFTAAMLAAGLSLVALLPAAAAQQQSYPAPGGGFAPPASSLQLPPLPTRQAITPNGNVIEDVIARVNDQIITRSEYDRADQQLLQEAQQQGLTQEQLDDRQHNLLRDMIDQQLLLSKGKQLGITGDTETMRELDDIRKKNNLADMEALQKAAEQQGVSFEDFKQRIRDSAITQQVVRDEVGRRLNLTHVEEVAYYAAHSKDFEVPEQVHLSEILIPTPDSATEAQLTAAQQKADEVETKLKAGGNFAELAKTSSGGPTASAGGDLGDFKRGTLGTVLENATFPLAVGGVTAPIRTKQGYVILRVDSHQAAGVPPLATVEPQVEEAIYLEQLQPALRAYLTKARQDAYVEIAPGFMDAGSPRKGTRPADIAYTAYKAPPLKKKVQAKQRMEQERAARAQAELAAAREKVAEKQAAKAEQHANTEQHASSNARKVSHRSKPRKIHKEKIRYGEAPRKALPAPLQAADAAPAVGSMTGVAPGVAMAPTQSVTSITTGTGVDTETTAEDLAPVSGPTRKTRFTSRESDAEEASAKTKLAKAEVKATDRPVVATPVQSATEKHQDAPLGLNGDTTKKPKKPKHYKGEAKERLEQEKPKPATTQVPVAPTVNPALATTPTNVAPVPATTPAPTQTPPQH